jgi:hypothetical protein
MDRITERDTIYKSTHIKEEMNSYDIAEAFKKLQKYENAEEDGLLKFLPCKEG